MFTGIIQALGRVESNRSSRLRLKTSLEGIAVGASVAVNGACLTAVHCSKGNLEFDLSPETLRLTNLAALRSGNFVNLETPLRMGGSLDGHLTSGHVDAASRVLEFESLKDGCARLRVALPRALRGLVAVKGSISINGVSLTVTRMGNGEGSRPFPRSSGRDTLNGRTWFETVLIPHTLRATNLGSSKAGDLVNLEADLIARYVQSLLCAKP